MGQTLCSERVAEVLARMRAEAAQLDPPAKARVAAREAELGHKIYGQEALDLYGDAHLSITPEVGALLYVLACASHAQVMVEFGASHGFSTIHLAAAARDCGEGFVITTELAEAKARQARKNLTDAGLSEYVDVREGNALVTLAGLRERVDLLFLDGWNDLYVDVLQLLEPNLAPGSLVIADMSVGDPQNERYGARAFQPDAGYLSVELPLDAGIVLSLRLGTSG